MKRTNRTIRRYAEVVAMLVAGPCTRIKLSTSVGYSNRESLANVLRALKAQGLIYTSEWKAGATRPIEVLAWQPSPFAMQDVPPPKAQGRVA